MYHRRLRGNLENYSWVQLEIVQARFSSNVLQSICSIDLVVEASAYTEERVNCVVEVWAGP